MLPLESVRLAWKSKPLADASGLELQDEWTSNADLQSILNFQFYCKYAHTHTACKHIC